MGKICLLINCRHYRPKSANATSSDKNQAPGARPGTSDASSSAANRPSRASTKCSVLSIPSMHTDDDQYFIELFKLSGNVDLIHARLTLAELKNKYGLCTCHFGDDQLNGRVRKSLIPGQFPRFNLAPKPISEELMTKFLNQQNEPKTPLDKLETIQVQISIPAGKKIKKRPPFLTPPAPDDLGNIENDAARANVEQISARPLAPQKSLIQPQSSPETSSKIAPPVSARLLAPQKSLIQPQSSPEISSKIAPPGNAEEKNPENAIGTCGIVHNTISTTPFDCSLLTESEINTPVIQTTQLLSSHLQQDQTEEEVSLETVPPPLLPTSHTQGGKNL